MAQLREHKTSWLMRLIKNLGLIKKSKTFGDDQYAQRLLNMAKKMKQSQPEECIPKWVKRHFDVRVKTYGNCPCYFLRNKDSSPTNYLIYFHGGAYFLPIMRFQWNFIAHLGLQTKSTICVPMYPLAPEYQYSDVPDGLSEFYKDLCRENQSNLPVNVIGDSAGGGLALSFAQLVRNENLPKAQKVILLSPSVDMSPMRPDEEEPAKKLDELDCMLSLKLVDMVVNLWCKDNDYHHYFASPIYGGLNDLNEIWLFSGTHDLLNLVAKRFLNQAQKENVPVHYIERAGMPHVWMFFLKTKEAKRELKNLVKIINNQTKECIIS